LVILSFDESARDLIFYKTTLSQSALNDFRQLFLYNNLIPSTSSCQILQSCAVRSNARKKSWSKFW